MSRARVSEAPTWASAPTQSRTDYRRTTAAQQSLLHLPFVIRMLTYADVCWRMLTLAVPPTPSLRHTYADVC